MVLGMPPTSHCPMPKTHYTAAYCREQAASAEKIGSVTSVLEDEAKFHAEVERWREKARKAEEAERVRSETDLA